MLMANPMPARFLGVSLSFLLLFESPCVGQTARPQAKTNTHSVQNSAPIAGDSCAFRGEDDVDTYPNCVLQGGQGDLFIAPDYRKKLKFDSHGLAVVFDEDHSRQGWMYVDRKGHVILKDVPSFDNWADEFSDGLVRTAINRKYGFADRHGKVVIPAKYDGALPFDHGYAVVCIGCREICIMPDHPRAESDIDCEHHMLTGGRWLKIDKAGRVVAKVSR